MSSITVVQKNGFAAIAADQMSVKGSCRTPGEYDAEPTKIVQVGHSLIGVTGSTAHVLVVRSLANNHADKFDLTSTDSIFETFRSLHKLLVREYYLLTGEDDTEQPYQSSQLFLLIANATGIYEVEGYREVMKYTKFWAAGSGREYALGAMEALYGGVTLSAQQVAERGLKPAAGSTTAAACRLNVMLSH